MNDSDLIEKNQVVRNLDLRTRRFNLSRQEKTIQRIEFINGTMSISPAEIKLNLQSAWVTEIVRQNCDQKPKSSRLCFIQEPCAKVHAHKKYLLRLTNFECHIATFESYLF